MKLRYIFKQTNVIVQIITSYESVPTLKQPSQEWHIKEMESIETIEWASLNNEAMRIFATKEDAADIARTDIADRET